MQERWGEESCTGRARPSLLPHSLAAIRVTRFASPAAQVEVTLADDGTPSFITGAFSDRSTPSRAGRSNRVVETAVIRGVLEALLNSNLCARLYHEPLA